MESRKVVFSAELARLREDNDELKLALQKATLRCAALARARDEAVTKLERAQKPFTEPADIRKAPRRDSVLTLARLAETTHAALACKSSGASAMEAHKRRRLS
eukprot:TRINITY_DN21987_c0_g1_i1.p1 TRINITY_DN21987_c0_g1~~TRINITY_DN21987_c0_g1_i1.p1  ORF type:complete len:103 (+),score=30.73 TRINITY_DN21987_c0_g1_i1:122-430(+)